MSEISNSDLLTVLLEIKGDIGQLQSTAASNVKALADHVAADAVMAGDIKRLQLGAARQRGFLTAITAVGTVVGAGVGYAIDLLARGHGH
jgi:hypothetical protein